MMYRGLAFIDAMAIDRRANIFPPNIKNCPTGKVGHETMEEPRVYIVNKIEGIQGKDIFHYVSRAGVYRWYGH